MPSAWGQSWGQAWGLSWGDTGAAPPPPAPVGESIKPPGGVPLWRVPQRRKPEQREIEQIIQAVAVDQVARLEKDEQKRFEELERELELKGVQWEARYLEALNVRREILIDQEIERLLKKKIENDNRILLILMALI